MKTRQHKAGIARGANLKVFYIPIMIIGLLLIFAPTPAPVNLISATVKRSSNAELFKVVGNKVFKGNEKVYIPYGISVFGGLEDPNYMNNLADDNAQIKAASKYWHANTIRLQVAESNLFSGISKGKDYNQNFLNQLIDQVNLAHSEHEVVVINDQTEFTTGLPSPTATTSRFWQVMSKVFGNQPNVIFDLFNEPRLEGFGKFHVPKARASVFNLFELPLPNIHKHMTKRMSRSEVWRVWENGGVVNGVRYIGMQTIVNQIRGLGVSNLIWIEGPYMASVLPESNHLLRGSNIEYSIHHPDLNKPSSWNAIGKLASIRPVVDGEWAQYASTWAECYSKAYTNAPLYLAYLQKHHVGLIAWSLQPGSLIATQIPIRPSNMTLPRDPRRASDLRTPSKLLHTYTCKNRFGQGAGQLIMHYFDKNSGI